MDIQTNFPSVTGVAPPGRTVWAKLGSQPRFISKSGIDNSLPGWTNESGRIRFYQERIRIALAIVNGDLTPEVVTPRQGDLTPNAIVTDILGCTPREHAIALRDAKKHKDIYKD